MFQSNIVSTVNIDDYILIHGPLILTIFDNYFKNSIFRALINTIADDIFLTTFFILETIRHSRTS